MVTEIPFIVQKYGGTSVGKFLPNLVQIIKEQQEKKQAKVVIVVSARSGESKSTGTTNLLLKAASQATCQSSSSSKQSTSATPANHLTMRHSNFHTPLSPPLSSVASPDISHSLAASLDDLAGTDFNSTVNTIKSDHLHALATVKDARIRTECEAEVEADCERLRAFLVAARIIDELSPRSQDSIVGLGERLACRLVVAALRDAEINAVLVSVEDVISSLDVSEFTVSTASDAVQTLSQQFYDKVSVRLGQICNEVSAQGSAIPVVTGFFGPVPGSLLAQVGRGYSDLCAALCAVGLKAKELQVWKEVDGIFSADPRKVATAKLIPIITPDEAAELTYYGSEVIHPFTMEQVIRARIPIRIKNVKNPSGSGTVIFPDDLPGVVSETKQLPKPGAPTAVTVKDSITVLNVRSNRKTKSHGFLARIFSTLDKYGVVVDLITTSEVHVSMAISATLPKRIVDKLIMDLGPIGVVSQHLNLSIVSLVGKQMKHSVGIAGKMFTTLAKGNINLEMISQGASEINISCVVKSEDALKAMNLIHQSCLQGLPSFCHSI